MSLDNKIPYYARFSTYADMLGKDVIAYIYAKETEIKVVRIIMVGKLNNMAGEVIRERLRDIYV